MEQVTEQVRGQQAGGRFQPGTSGNPQGRPSRAARAARRERIVADWCQPYGGIAALKPAELALLDLAAELSLRHPRTAEDAVRIANSVSRLLAQCGICHQEHVKPRQPVEASAPAPSSGESGLAVVQALMREHGDGNN